MIIRYNITREGKTYYDKEHEHDEACLMKYYFMDNPTYDVDFECENH